MSAPEHHTVVEAGENAVRVWRAGSGPVIGYLAGLGGLTKWTPFLDRLAERRTVIVPSLPGFPGGGMGHLTLDTQLDWLLAVKDILDACGLNGADMVAGNVAGALLADVAALWPASVRRMSLIAPHGLYLDEEPPVDLWAQKPDALGALVCVSDGWTEQRERPRNEDPIEWQIEQNRASETVARIFWPMGSTDLDKRLGRITTPTQILRGSHDIVLPASYAEQFRQRLIPTCIDHDPRAHLRRPMVMMALTLASSAAKPPF